MKIGIVEVMPHGHYTLVQSICSIFTSCDKNEVFIFTNSKGAGILRPAIASFKKATVVEMRDESLASFLSKIKSYKIERLYITTLEKYFRIFYTVDFGRPVHLVIHNTDEWINVTYRYRIHHLISEFSFSTRYAYVLKRMILYPRWRKKIITGILKASGKLVVLNHFIKKELTNYIESDRIEVIPFSVFDKNLVDNSVSNKKIRICIPGVLSRTRRNYFAVFNIIEKNIDLFKQSIELDLLGGITSCDYDKEIITFAERLIEKGAVIQFSKTAFIPIEEFNKRLASSDIILGNINVLVDKYSSYGKTKETGVIFTMIHAAKPGIIISGYPIPDELLTSTITFSSYKELESIIKDLISDQNKLRILKENAKTNSLHYEPSRIYQSIK